MADTAAPRAHTEVLPLEADSENAPIVALPLAPLVLADGRYVRWVKPVLDRLIAVVLLIALLPLLLLAAAAVRISLGPGVLFRQERVGLAGRRFTLYKLRSLHHSRRREQQPYEGDERRHTHKHPHDPRLSRVGKVLRKLSVDELPQLINILKGDMSVVGPRPELPFIVEDYEPWQHRRHGVKPGLTGLWQVSARDCPMHECTEIDLDYVDRISFRTDLTIMLRTIPTIIGRGRAW